MTKSLTEKIEVSVETKFEEIRLISKQRQFIFSYQIRIDNHSQTSVKLLSRHWFIFDSRSHYSEVKGDGVVGEQPLIEAGSSYSYESFCQLQSDMGMMWGTYLMRNEDERLIEVKIPEFELIVPYRLN
tara:strand:+ start:494 stop:877 length:384 start_codon:yes stop_codon:yes gene_type:complete